MIIKLTFLLSSIGFLISAYLLWTYLTGAPIACSVGGCELVRESPYSYIWGIPQPLLGVVFYFTIMVLAGFNDWIRKTSIIKIDSLFVLITASGFSYSIYLTYLEAFVIRAYCVWCVASTVLATSLFFITLSRYYGKIFKF